MNAVIGIIVAMEIEFALMKQTLSDITVDMPGYCIGVLGDKKIILQKSGVGKVNSALATAKLISTEHPDYIINSGVAGGLDRSVAQGDVVVGEYTAYHDLDIGEEIASQDDLGFPRLIPADPKLLARIKDITAHDNTIKYGLICTGDQFITNNDALMVIKGKFPEALAVDMESNSIAHACYQNGVPFISIRIISDTPWVDYQPEQYAAFWKSAPQRLFQIVSEIIR